MLAMLCFNIALAAGASAHMPTLQCGNVDQIATIQQQLGNLQASDPTGSSYTSQGLSAPFVMQQTDARWNTYAPPQYWNH